MAIGTTLKANMIVPEVMADFIDSQLPNHIAFYPLLKIDQTLVGQPGDTLTRPAWAYSGDASDVLENQAIPIDQLTASTTTATIKKIGKAIELTDEAVLSGAGGVMNAASRDIGMAIGNKVEKDVLAALRAYNVQTSTFDASVEGLNAALLSFTNMRDFNEKSVMIVSPRVAASIRMDAIRAGGWLSGTELGASRVVNGVYGEVLNTQFLVHDLVQDNEAFLVRSGAVALLDKRGMFLETDRDILKKTTVLAADKHYGVYIYDPSRIVKLAVNPAKAITFTAAQKGGATGTADSTSIEFVFSSDVWGLTASKITVADGSGAGAGSATKGALTGSGKNWSLAITPTAEGTVGVTIADIFGFDFPATAAEVAIYAES